MPPIQIINPTSIIEKVPPQNIEAEQSVLGALLIDGEAIMKIADVLTPEDFYRPNNETIFRTMLELTHKHEPIDVISLTNRLKELNLLEQIGGESLLAELSSQISSSSNIAYYANIIQKKATLRRLIRTAGDILDLGWREEEDVERILDEAEQRLFNVSQKYLKQNFIPLKAILAEAFERIDELHREKGKLRGLPTGFPDLDNMLAGLQKSDLIVLAARPSVGKTSLALDIVRQAATKFDGKVAVFSLEMSKEQLVDRLLCAESGVDLWRLRTGRLADKENDDDFPRIGQAMGILSEASIFIDDSSTANIMEIRTKARRLKAEHGLDLMVIDYLQLMEGRTVRDNRVQEITEITRSLKSMARELSVPVVAISQLSRAVELRNPPIPKLADLRESGSIEQDADVVLFIYREEMYKKEVPRPHIAEIHIAKHRNGPTGTIELYFDAQRASFKSLSKESYV